MDVSKNIHPIRIYPKNIYPRWIYPKKIYPIRIYPKKIYPIRINLYPIWIFHKWNKIFVTWTALEQLSEKINIYYITLCGSFMIMGSKIFSKYVFKLVLSAVLKWMFLYSKVKYAFLYLCICSLVVKLPQNCGR